MARKQRESQEINELIELGIRNAKLMQEVQRWCTNLTIIRTSAGLLAQAYNLPIGMLRVNCPHATSLSESMHLDSVSRYFVLNNCIGCPYHQEISSDNYGRKIILEEEKLEAGRKGLQEYHAALTLSLREQAQQLLSANDVPQRSINDLILALQDVEVSSNRFGEISEQLEQAANVAPEHFSDAALQVLVSNPDKHYTAIGLAVCKYICAYRKTVPQFVFDSAVNALDHPYYFGGDAACGILIEYCNYHDINDLETLIPKVLPVADFYNERRDMSPIIRKETHFLNVLMLVRLLCEHSPYVTREAFKTRLRINHKETKYNTAKLLQSMLPEFAGEILPLASALLQSLELDDDHYEMSADRAVCELLAHLYVYSPEEMEKEINSYWPFTSQEVKGLITDIYRIITTFAESEIYESTLLYSRETYLKHVPTTIKKLHMAMTDITLDVDLRLEICESLESAIKPFPDIAFGYFDRFLGQLAMVIREAQQTRPDRSNVLEYMAHEARFSRFVNTNTKLIRALVRYDPSSAYPKLTKLLQSLEMKDQEWLKAELVRILDEFGRVDELITRLVPELYIHLTNYDSNLVRAEGIRVTGELLKQIPAYIPSNMIELLVVYLGDQYIIIHKYALRALSNMQFEANELGVRALAGIMSLEKYYSEEKGEDQFLEDIVRTLSSSFRAWPQVKKRIITDLLPKYSQHPDYYFSKKMLAKLAQAIEEYPEVAPLFVERALVFLHNDSSNTSYQDHDLDRATIWDGLFNVPPHLFKIHVDKLRLIAFRMIENAPWGTYSILELMWYMDLHVEALETTEALIDALPRVKSTAHKVRSLELLHAAERVELLCKVRDFEKAILILETVNSSVLEP